MTAILLTTMKLQSTSKLKLVWMNILPRSTCNMISDSHTALPQNRAIHVLPGEVRVLHIASRRQLPGGPRKEDHPIHQEAKTSHCSAGCQEQVVKDSSSKESAERQETSCVWMPGQERAVQMLGHAHANVISNLRMSTVDWWPPCLRNFHQFCLLLMSIVINPVCLRLTSLKVNWYGWT